MDKKMSEQKRKDILATIHDYFLTIAKESFPKQCSCGRRYENLEEFLAGTEGVEDGRGLFLDDDFAGGSVVDLLRNCTCGSTLMIAFETRRDWSSEGNECRTVFGRLHEFFTGCGLDANTVRSELLKTAQGETRPLLENAFSEREMSGMEKDFIRLQTHTLRILMKK